MITETKNTKAFYNTEIPSDWEVAELGKITEKIGDGLHGTPEYINCSEYFFINGNNLKDGTIQISEGTKCVSEEEYLKHKKDLKYKSILLSINGTIGSVAFFKNEKIVLGKSAAYINCKDENVDFLFHYLQSKTVINFFEGELTGSTIRNLSLKSIREIPIPLPPLLEQKAIAKVLSTADAAIHTTEKLIAQKELRKKWLIQQLLTGKKRLKGFGGEWKEKKLSDLFDRVTRKNTEGNTTVVTISAQRGFVRQTDFFNKNIASEITDNYFLVERGEFCYNKSYSNGYPWGATKRLNDFDKAVVTTLYICFGIKNEKKTSADFFEQYFRANHLDKGLTKIAHEGGRAHGLLNVTPSDFFSLKVSIPSIEEQTAIAQVLQAADKEISLLKAKAEKLREQKKGLMQVLLTGKVRLKIK
jgi:type I restriction enzyme S subunit